MDKTWAERVTDFNLTAGDPLDFTRNAAAQVHDIVWLEEFEDCDAAVIYEYLYNRIKPVSFADYLKRYIYEKAELTGDYKTISLSDYRDIIIGSFRDTGTPKSFRETSTKFPAMVRNWLTQDTVSRETVFLLGFGLNMPAEDVSGFLTKAIREQDFNFKDPREVIFWHCLKNHLGAAHVLHYLKQYETLAPDYAPEVKLDGTIAARDYARSVKDTDLFTFLARLKAANINFSISRTAVDSFSQLLREAKKEVLRQMKTSGEAEGRSTPEDVTDADFERSLYNGVPVDERGNLTVASASRLKKNFSSKRLSRQRISSIIRGKAPVERSDLITLEFYLYATRHEDVSADLRYRRFLIETNDLLASCYMGPLNISNPYEAFIIMCLLTDYPMDSFSDVWETSYREE